MDSNARRRPNNQTNQYHEDEVQVLTGPKTSTLEEGKISYEKGAFYTSPVATCSRRQAILILGVILATLLACSLIVAFVRPAKCDHVDEGFNFHDEVKPTSPPEAFATNGDPFPWNDIRLPTTLLPLQYSVVLHPNLTTLFLRGEMKVIFTVLEETNFIVFHGNNVTLTVVMVKDKNQREVLNTRILYYPYHQQIYIELKNYLKVGSNYSLALRYEGTVRTDLEGIYLSTYNLPNKKKRRLVATNFQPTSARSAFPCWDEPQYKASFKISAVRQRDYLTLSNMPLDNTEDVSIFWGSGLVQDNFKDSKAMSTYLVALVVSDYTRVQDISKSGVVLSVYTPPKMIKQAEFALGVATRLFDFFQYFFGVSYPLPKLDLIAVPDFAPGAMENWGLALFRESALLLDKNTTSSAAKQRVVLIIAHEIAHQWFGDLVTMKWWDDLWLNEGFASFAEYLGVDRIFPEWNMMDQFVHSITMPALKTDALGTSHPISVTVSNPIEIEAIFDTISYNKGAAILYMLQRVLGEDSMRFGLTLYLEKHKYANADTNDLWTSLSTASRNSSHPVDVKVIMDSWTQQLGYPLVTLRRHGNLIHASQKHFLLVNSSVHRNASQKWYIPLTFTTSASPKSENQIWMHGKDVSFEIPTNVTWIKANINQSGFYRVNYDSAMWRTLTKLMTTDHNAFSATDRAQLIDDAFTLTWTVQWTGEFRAGVTLIYYRREGEQEEVHIPGPSLENLRFLLLFRTENPGVKYSYTVANENITRKPEFRWEYMDWSVCTATCGGGTQLSQPKCMEIEAGLVQETYCAHMDKPQEKSRPCNKQSCPARWWVGPWQYCSLTCGDKGIRRRTVICVRSLSDDEQVALHDADCPINDRPTEEDLCPDMPPCPGQVTWKTGPWLKCSEDPCDMQRREVECSVAGGSCADALKPPEERQCGNIICGTWNAGNWSECSASCGDGVQFRRVSCLGGMKCRDAFEPESIQQCRNACAGWSPPTPEIANDILDNDIVAEKEKVKVEEEEEEDEEEEEEVTEKTEEEKRPDYAVEDKVSVDDIQVLEMQNVTVDPIEMDSNDIELSDEGFNIVKKMSIHVGEDAIHFLETLRKTDEVDADVDDVAIDVSKIKPNFNWKIGLWTKCSVLCDGGTRVRDVSCYELTTSTLVDDALCTEDKPEDVESCNENRCMDWVLTSWSVCSVTCGQGIKTREVRCPEDDKCNPNTKPNEEFKCIERPCVDWVPGPWTSCSASCGGGHQLRGVQCMDRRSSTPVDGCEHIVKPRQRQRCAVKSCPRSNRRHVQNHQGRLSACHDKLDTKLCATLKHMCGTWYFKVKCCSTCRKHSRQPQSRQSPP